MQSPEKSKYFVDHHGVLVFEQQISLDVRIQFKAEGVFSWDGKDFSWDGKDSQARELHLLLGFIVENYRKFVKTK